MDQPTAPSLRELQLWMKWIITDPRGVAPALANPFPANLSDISRYTSPKKSVLPWISETPPMKTVERLDIYAEAYFIRILESMKTDFPITFQVLGDLSFQKLVADYLKKFPSSTYNITEIGKKFSNFVANYEDLMHVEILETLIHMEWLTIESFFAKNTGFIDTVQLGLLSEEAWEKTSFLLADSVRLIESQWSLDRIWQHKGKEVDFERSEKPQYFLLLRELGDVSIEALTEPAFQILKSLRSGTSLIAALEEAQNKFADQDIGTDLMGWFNEWTRRGVICSLKTETEKVVL